MEPEIVPSTPSPTIQAIVYALLRSIMMLLAALGIGVGSKLDDGTLMIVAGALVAMGTAAWSLWDKIQSAKKTHETAVVSALAREPVEPRGS